MTEEKAKAVAAILNEIDRPEWPYSLVSWDDFYDVLDAIATLLGPSEREQELSARLEHWQDAYRNDE